MIYYTTIAYRQFYRDISLRLIESFLKYTSDSQLIVITDNFDTYQNYLDHPNIKIIKGPDWDDGAYFKANMKYICLREINNFCSIDDIVVYMDADYYFINRIDNSIFNIIQCGLNVPFGKNPYKVNPNEIGHAHRVKILIIHPDENCEYYCFLEGMLVFKVDEKFTKFIEEWEKIYFIIENEKMTHSAETYDIQIAAMRSNLQLNNIRSNQISASIRMTDVKNIERIAFL
jgi:hypothetical protein